MSAVLVAVIAAIAWGISDYGAAVKARTVSVFVVTGASLGVGGLGAMLALGLQGAPSLHSRTALLAALAAGLTLVGLTSLYEALSEGRMSIVGPISATGVSLPVIAGFVGGNLLAWNQALGIVLAIIGMIVLVGSQSGNGRTSLRPVLVAVIAALGLGRSIWSITRSDGIRRSGSSQLPSFSQRRLSSVLRSRADRASPQVRMGALVGCRPLRVARLDHRHHRPHRWPVECDGNYHCALPGRHGPSRHVA